MNVHDRKAIKRVVRENGRPDDPSLVYLLHIKRALTVLAIIACAFALWAAQAIIVPTAFALVLALALSPVVRALERWHVPTPLASLLVVLATAAFFALTAIALAPSVADWIREMPQIAQTVEHRIQPIKEWLQTFQAASSQLGQIANVDPTPSAVPTATVQAASESFIQSVPAFLAQAIYTIVLALFLINVRETYRKRLILLPSDRFNRLRVARIMNETLTQVSGYLFVLTSINVGLAIATTLAFTAAGVPNALLWGVIFGAASFIPYIGPTGTIITCALVQLATRDTIAEAAVPPLILLGLNLVEANFVTPWLVSRRVAVSSVAVFVTVVAFAWLWGPLAAIVAVPLLILFSAIARHVPSLQPLAVLLLAENETRLDVTDSARARFFGDDAVRAKTWWWPFEAAKDERAHAPVHPTHASNSEFDLRA